MAPPPDIGDNLTLMPSEMTVAALQEALSKRGLDTKWNPLKSKKELVDRLQVGAPLLLLFKSYLGCFSDVNPLLTS